MMMMMMTMILLSCTDSIIKASVLNIRRKFNERTCVPDGERDTETLQVRLRTEARHELAWVDDVETTCRMIERMNEVRYEREWKGKAKRMMNRVSVVAVGILTDKLSQTWYSGQWPKWLACSKDEVMGGGRKTEARVMHEEGARMEEWWLR